MSSLMQLFGKAMHTFVSNSSFTLVRKTGELIGSSRWAWTSIGHWCHNSGAQIPQEKVTQQELSVKVHPLTNPHARADLKAKGRGKPGRAETNPLQPSSRSPAGGTGCQESVSSRPRSACPVTDQIEGHSTHRTLILQRLPAAQHGGSSREQH